MKKTIITLYGRQGEGKSSTIKTACKFLLSNYPNATLDPDYDLDYSTDILVIIHLGPIKIGIESQGDPNSRMFWGNSIENFAKVDKCDIILCTSRTSGGTVDKIDNIAANNKYHQIWLSSTISSSLNHDVLNHLAADNIIRLIESLIVGRL